MRISDWSSDVCSSDLQRDRGAERAAVAVRFGEHIERLALRGDRGLALRLALRAGHGADRRGDLRQEGALLGESLGGFVHPLARRGIDRFARRIVADAGMTAVAKATEMHREIGRATWRERGCQSGSNTVGAG